MDCFDFARNDSIIRYVWSLWTLWFNVWCVRFYLWLLRLNIRSLLSLIILDIIILNTRILLRGVWFNIIIYWFLIFLWHIWSCWFLDCFAFARNDIIIRYVWCVWTLRFNVRYIRFYLWLSWLLFRRHVRS